MKPSADLRDRLLQEIMAMPAIDVHSHVPADAPFARSLRDILGYHYYTELAHSAGMPKDVIAPDAPDEQMIPGLLEAMRKIDNTAQYSWLVELCRELFGLKDPRLTPDNWEPVAEQVRLCAGREGRAREIMEASRIDKVFLTNNFDEDLSEVDTDLFVPSLRADVLVFKLHTPQVRSALERVGGAASGDAAGLRQGLTNIVQAFCEHGARSAAISVPPGFAVREVTDAELDRALATWEPDEAGHAAIQSGVMFALSALCREHGIPFQIMSGVVRDAYAHGVPGGTDLPVAGTSLSGLLPLFNAFPEVTFCLSILSDNQIQELNSFGWIVQNVVLSGHWWYLNVPEYIAYDCAARIQSVPKTKLIGYYSDAYKLEFALAKFNMYRRLLADVLAGRFVELGLGTEEDALALARLMLRDNAARVFGLQRG